jgi:S1-C subfamily serine protease
MIHLFAIALLLASPMPAKKAADPGWIGMGYTWSGNHRALNVRNVASGGPADRAGIRPGDIITSIDGRRVDFGDELELLLFLGEHRAGSRMSFGIVRTLRRRMRSVVIGASHIRIETLSSSFRRRGVS